MRSRNTLIAVADLLLLLPTAQVRAATCYNVDLTESADKAMAPCYPDADVSPCCAINKGTRSDICMDSGLCYAQDGNYRGFIYMNGCTDSTGLSSDCPHICPDATTDWGGGSEVASWNVLQCNLGTYCCRPAGETANCCDNSTAVVSTNIGTLLLATATATTTAGTGTAAATVTVTGTSGAAATAEGAACPADKTAVVGGAVGGALGAALLALLGALAFLMKRRRDQATSNPAPPQGPPSMAQSPDHVQYYSKPVQSPDVPYANPQELPSRSRYEMQ